MKMKKTLIALLSLAGVAAAATDAPVSVWSLEGVSLAGHTEYTQDAGGVALSSLNVAGSTGYTAMITMNWTQVANAPAFWFATTDGAGYGNSTATFGYKRDDHHATLFSTGGSNRDCVDNYKVADEDYTSNRDNAPDYIVAGVGDNGDYGSLDGKTLTYFVTSSGGTSELFELLNDGSVTKIATQTGMQSGTLGTLYVGHWFSGDSHQAGTMSVQLFNRVLDSAEMKSLVIPEPTTAALSLLALAGLAARRRRR